MKISHPGPTDHNPKGAVPHTRHSPLLLYAHQHTARAPRPPERSPPEGNAPNGDKHSKACRQLGTYDEQLGTYVEQLGTWEFPSAELFLRSGEQSRAMRARKYRTPSVLQEVQGRAGSHALPVRELQVRTLSNLLPSQFEAKVYWEGVASSPPLSSLLFNKRTQRSVQGRAQRSVQ